MAVDDDRLVGREQARSRAMWVLAVAGAVSVLATVVLALLEPGMSAVPFALGIPFSYFMIGMFVWWRAPQHLVARRMLATSTLVAVLVLDATVERTVERLGGAAEEVLPRWALISMPIGDAVFGLVVVMVIGLIALLPDGRYRFAYERVALRVLWLLPPLYALNRLPGLPKLFPFPWGNWLLLLGPVLLVVRYVRLPRAERRKVRWLLGVAALVAGAILTPLIVMRLLPVNEITVRVLGPLAVAAAAAGLVVIGVRYRMLGADLGIRWTTRYGLLWLIFGLSGLVAVAFVSDWVRSALPLAVAVVVLAGAYSVRISVELAARLSLIQRQSGELAASRTRIVQAQDTERRRIERNLHDGIQQELVALVAKLRLTRNKLPSGADQAQVILTEVQDDVYRVIDELREFVHGIHPPELTDQGLVAAVRSRARRVPIPVTVVAEPPVDAARYAIDVEESAYFLVSEALTNVLKHAHASRATIRLALVGGFLVIEITDDGIGKPGGFREGSGLIGLRDRVGATGGSLEVTGSPDGGTTVRAQLPAREVTTNAEA
ncbi:sensor histidine kinase [Amycolatopsis sp. DG1A-15b]|uniref:sensor histidine kinase n=1 Tax=Amycolatopsis sp. DG1A-15b TaxID=3052846 RepID=UPI00255BB799|nr:sensor histidine kinase [Amycolatopsis sp. DG1A-15b]WIX85709.1 sensor histidine kinase [Amycolatopsis sp. DG1A-15b]